MMSDIKHQGDPSATISSCSFHLQALSKFDSTMVFESIVADLLNRYLGEYVVNLDASQLNIGIWAGRVFFCSQYIVEISALQNNLLWVHLCRLSFDVLIS